MLSTLDFSVYLIYGRWKGSLMKIGQTWIVTIRLNNEWEAIPFRFIRKTTLKTISFESLLEIKHYEKMNALIKFVS